MEMPLSELIDKLSIVKLKIERVGEPQLQKEYEAYLKAIEEFEKKGVIIKKIWVEELYSINKQCWDLEWDARKITASANIWEEAEKFGLAELGRRALIIGDLMKKRADVKSEIARESKIGFEDKKINHVGN
ncbi:MAG: hypothetical protein Q7S56_02490 [Nanoarchaeota archaeon]|nr:hypothetical protein [Nanoarchaeota archaeon]